jgi:tetratricopeptide (TPR) repeat protein
MLTWLSSFWDAITTPPLRDYIATSAATAVFIIGLFTLTQRRTEFKSTRRKQLTEYIAKIHDLNVEQGKSRAANKKGDYPPDFNRLIMDQKRFVTRQMDYLANKIRNMVTPYEWLVLATSLDDIGDQAQAEKYFKKAFLSYARNNFEKIIFARQYARFLFQIGRIEDGRRLYLFAVSTSKGNSPRDITYLADTFERWARAEADFGDRNQVSGLLDRAQSTYGRLRNSSEKDRFMDEINLLRSEYDVDRGGRTGENTDMAPLAEIRHQDF